MVKRHLAGLIVAAVIAGGGVAAVAAAAPDSGTPASSSAPSTPAPAAGQKRAQGGAMLRRVVHGDLVVRGKGGAFENVTLDKGTVESKGDKTLTIKRADGKTVTIKVDDSTKYRGVDSFDAVQTGKPAIVLSHDGLARVVGQRAMGGNIAKGGNV